MFIIFSRMMFYKIVGMISLSYFPCNEKVFYGYLVTNTKILHIHCTWSLLIDCIVGNASGGCIYVNTFVIVCGCPISSKMCRKMMKYPPVTNTTTQFLHLLHWWQQNLWCCNKHVLVHLGALALILNI